jgi:hypothetical protein
MNNQQVIRQLWSDPDRWAGVVVAAAPSLVFVAVNVMASLYPAIIAAAVTALAGLGYRLARRQSPRSALIGILVVAVCAVVAAVTGEARGFFLVPALIPFAVIVICLGTIVARRPLTGLILNRVTGGPPDWYRHPALRRVHLIATGAAIAVNAVNATVQAIFYGRGDTVVLAVAHVATGPIFATLVALTIVAARRTMAAQRSEEVKVAP